MDRGKEDDPKDERRFFFGQCLKKILVFFFSFLYSEYAQQKQPAGYLIL